MTSISPVCFVCTSPSQVARVSHSPTFAPPLLPWLGHAKKRTRSCSGFDRASRLTAELESQTAPVRNVALTLMYSAQFAFGLQEGLSKAEICAKPEMRSLPKGNMCRVWGGTPKYVTMLLALSMLLDLRLDCNGRGSDGSDGSDGTGVIPGVVSPLVLSSQAGGSGGEGLNLGSVLLKCAACSGQDEGEGLELEFLRECITAAGLIWNGIVLPYCKENASENSVALFQHQNTYLGALIPSLLQKIRIVGPGGALQVVSGSCLIECFNKFFLNAPKGHFNNDNATDLLIMMMSVANVDWTAHQSVEGADSEDCCVDKVLKACLEDDSFSDRASVLQTHSWQSLLGTLVTPRVPSAGFHRIWNGWCTTGRFQQEGICCWGCSGSAQDSIEHYYVHCKFLRELLSRRFGIRPGCN